MSIPVELTLRERDLCFIDTETTGTQIGYHELIEIGAVRASPDGQIVRGEWSAKILPKFPERITPAAQKLNGFSLTAWRDASRTSRSVWENFVNFASGCIPVCHNPSFDRAFITLSAAIEGVQELGVDYHWIGVESLAWPLYRSGVLPRLSLSDICLLLGVPPEPAVHNALSGAAACRQVYLALMQRYERQSTGMIARDDGREHISPARAGYDRR